MGVNKKKRNAVLIPFTIILIISGVFYLLTLRSPKEVSKEKPSFSDLDSAYASLVDLRSSLQRIDRNSESKSISDIPSFLSTFPGISYDEAMDNGYAVVADFSHRTEIEGSLPPLLMYPKKWIRNDPTGVFPVFLLHPMDNPPNNVMHLVRVGLFDQNVVSSFVEEGEFSSRELQAKFGLEAEADHELWRFYSQDTILRYTSTIP